MRQFLNIHLCGRNIIDKLIAYVNDIEIYCKSRLFLTLRTNVERVCVPGYVDVDVDDKIC